MSQRGLSGSEPSRTLFTPRLPVQTYLEGEIAGTVDKHMPTLCPRPSRAETCV